MRGHISAKRDIGNRTTQRHSKRSMRIQRPSRFNATKMVFQFLTRLPSARCSPATLWMPAFCLTRSFNDRRSTKLLGCRSHSKPSNMPILIETPETLLSYIRREQKRSLPFPRSFAVFHARRFPHRQHNPHRGKQLRSRFFPSRLSDRRQPSRTVEPAALRANRRDPTRSDTSATSFTLTDTITDSGFPALNHSTLLPTMEITSGQCIAWGQHPWRPTREVHGVCPSWRNLLALRHRRACGSHCGCWVIVGESLVRPTP